MLAAKKAEVELKSGVVGAEGSSGGSSSNAGSKTYKSKQDKLNRERMQLKEEEKRRRRIGRVAVRVPSSMIENISKP